MFRTETGILRNVGIVEVSKFASSHYLLLLRNDIFLGRVVKQQRRSGGILGAVFNTANNSRGQATSGYSIFVGTPFVQSSVINNLFRS